MLRQQDQMVAAMNAGPSAPPVLDLDKDGALLIWPQNWPAVRAWIDFLHDQWLWTGMEGRIVAFNKGLALEIARELATVDRSIEVMPLVSRICVIADEVLRHMREEARR